MINNNGYILKQNNSEDKSSSSNYVIQDRDLFTWLESFDAPSGYVIQKVREASKGEFNWTQLFGKIF